MNTEIKVNGGELRWKAYDFANADFTLEVAISRGGKLDSSRSDGIYFADADGSYFLIRIDRQHRENATNDFIRLEHLSYQPAEGEWASASITKIAAIPWSPKPSEATPKLKIEIDKGELKSVKVNDDEILIQSNVKLADQLAPYIANNGLSSSLEGGYGFLASGTEVSATFSVSTPSTTAPAIVGGGATPITTIDEPLAGNPSRVSTDQIRLCSCFGETSDLRPNNWTFTAVKYWIPTEVPPPMPSPPAPATAADWNTVGTTFPGSSESDLPQWVFGLVTWVTRVSGHR